MPEKSYEGLQSKLMNGEEKVCNSKHEANLNLATREGNFVEDGFTIIRNAISPELIRRFQATVKRTLHTLLADYKIESSGELQNEESDLSSVIFKLLKVDSPFNVLVPVWKQLSSEGIISKLLLEKPIFDLSTEILGPDLSHTDDPALTLNLPGLSNSKENYLFKAFHQEVWSGSAVTSIQFWTPLFQSNNLGGIGLIKASHLWGHIPHRNRQPTYFPENFSEIKANLEIGDAIIFHTLAVHRSLPIDANGKPRIALTCSLRNFRTTNHSYEMFKNWKIYAYSDISNIERRLGNHYLSPFRLLEVDNPKFDK